MALLVAGRRLNRIAVIDDDEHVRASYAESLEDLNVEPVDIPGPLGDIGGVWDTWLKACDAVLTDLVLKGSGYAPYNGGVIAVEGVRRQIPVIVCTSYSDVNRQLPRSERRRIPAVLSAAQFDNTLISRGLEKSIQEIEGKFSPDRRPWRTQVEIVDVMDDGKYIWVMVLGRSPDEKVGLYIDELPQEIRQLVSKGRILHAVVNTGAKKADDLFFDQWEPK